MKYDLSAENEILQLKEKLASEKRHRENVEEILQNVLDSYSWRITAPLRSVQKARRTLFPLLKYKKHVMSAEAIRHIKKSGEWFEVEGTTPELSLQSNKGYSPRGYVLVQSSVKTASPIHFVLYYSSNGAFNGGDKFWLSLDGTKELLKLPKDTTSLRLDPFNSHSPFELNNFTITEIGTLQAVYLKCKRIVLPLLKNPRALIKKLGKALSIFREGGFTALRARFFQQEPSAAYDEWVQKYDTLRDSDRNKIKMHISKLSYTPTISVIMPTYNTPERWLRLAIESVKRQLYPHWELCIADDASTESSVATIIEAYAKEDQRIKFIRRERNGHISAASQSALSLAQGEYIALLDHDDEITEDALYQIASELNEHRDAELIYSDEDKKLTDGRRFNPHFKSDWNYDLFLQQNYICHLAAFKTETVRKVGGFREGCDGAQDWDLMLRVIDAVPESTIRHIPHILYHWRYIESSTASSTSAKPYVLEAQKKAVSDHLQRRGIPAHVSIREDISNLKVQFLLEKEPLVSLIIPSKDQFHILKQCVESIKDKTTYQNYEILIIDNASTEEEALSYLSFLNNEEKVRVVRDAQPFNFSKINNDAAKIAKGEILGFINNDIEVITPEWLTEMVSILIRKDVGAVGAKLFYPSDVIQHAGIITGIGGIAGHNQKGRAKHDPGYFNRITLCQDLSAITAACMVMKREVFDEIKGFDEDLTVAFNDVDLSLRVREAGYKLVYCAHAELYHYESVSRGYETTPQKFARFEEEVTKMKIRWKNTLIHDPYYNPNLTLLTEDFAIAYPPRSKKPWCHA